MENEQQTEVSAPEAEIKPDAAPAEAQAIAQQVDVEPRRVGLRH